MKNDKIKGRIKQTKPPVHQSWHPAADDLCHQYVLHSAVDVIRFPKLLTWQKNNFCLFLSSIFPALINRLDKNQSLLDISLLYHIYPGVCRFFIHGIPCSSHQISGGNQPEWSLRCVIMARGDPRQRDVLLLLCQAEIEEAELTRKWHLISPSEGAIHNHLSHTPRPART